MFERFTDRARRVVVLAQEESRLLNHNYIGTEHLLLGLICEDEGVAAKTLKSLHLTQESIHQQVKEIIGQGDKPTPPGHIPFTSRAKKMLELALREALQLGHNYIGTEHLLLALIREGEGVAAQVLKKGVEGGLDTVRNRVIAILNRDFPPSEPDSPGTITIRFSPEALRLLWDAEEKARGERVTVRHIMLALLADNGPLDRMMRTTGEVNE